MTQRSSIFLCLILVVSISAYYPHHRIVTNNPVTESNVHKRDFNAQSFAQLLDHNNPNSPTFIQRYWVNDMFWDTTSGPIFIYVGGEVSMYTTDVTATQWARYAQTNNGVVVALEHRYFGGSMPFSDLNDLTYLTVEQAMSDVVYFLEKFKASRGVGAVQVITLGSSYGGNLASWLRIKYPNIFSSAVASSAPVQVTREFGGYAQVVRKSIDTITGSNECTNAIHAAFTALEALLADASNFDSITHNFTLCYPVQGSYTEIGTLISNQMEIWSTAVQYNNVATIQSYCSVMIGPGNPIDKLASVNNKELAADHSSCLNSAYDSLISYYRTIVINPNAYVGYRQYFWLQCTQLGYFMTTSANFPYQPFGSSVPISLFDAQCRDTFGLTQTAAAAVDSLNKAFGGQNPQSVGASNIIYTNGEVDPWNILSVTTTLTPNLVAFNIAGAGHSADIFPAYGNPASVQNVQNGVSTVITQQLRAPAATPVPTPSSSAAAAVVPAPSDEVAQTQDPAQPPVQTQTPAQPPVQTQTPAQPPVQTQAPSQPPVQTQAPALISNNGQATNAPATNVQATRAQPTSAHPAAPVSSSNSPAMTQNVDTIPVVVSTQARNQLSGSASRLVVSGLIAAALLCAI